MNSVIAASLLAPVLFTGAVVSQEKASRDAKRADALRMRQKVAIIAERGSRASGAQLETLVTEREVNAYLEVDAELPAGITQPRLAIHGDRKVSGTAVVDLDAVRQQHKPSGMFDPVSYVGGKLPVAASGFLEARDGQARFQLESAEIAGVPIPKVVLAEVVSYYTRSPAYPRGIDIDDPFPLPARIRRIDVRRAEALVVQ